jgi:hypothetical protein
MTGRALVSIRQALSDPNLLGKALEGETWLPWRVLLIAAMGEALTDDERVIFERVTGRPTEPLERCEELWAIVGRRGGKSRASAVLCVYLACLVDYSHVLAVGERPSVLCLARNAQQAGVVLSYAIGIIRSTPMLCELVTSEAAESITLSSGIVIEVRAANFRGLRGGTYLAIVADECAFWFDEASGSANCGAEILASVRPGLATTGGMLCAISSPYSKRGELYTTWARHYGEKGDPKILVARGESRAFNPSLPQAFIDRQMEKDPVSAASEYGACWRLDIEAFIDRLAVEACVDIGVYERPPRSGVRYFGGADPAGGSGADSYTLAVAHRAADDTVVLDLLREARPPFSPEAITAEYAGVLKAYHVTNVVSDHWGGDWPAEQFRKHGVTVTAADKTKSQYYGELLPLLNSGRVDLLDDKRMISQLIGLERRVSRGGRDSINHGPGAGQHDDKINAAAIAIVLASATHGFEISDELLRRSRLPGPTTRWSRRPMSAFF